MKKKALFLAAGVAALAASTFAQGATYAAQSAIKLESQDDITIAKALSASDDGRFVYTKNGPLDMGDALIIGPGEIKTSLELDCSNGDPLAGVTDFSLLSRNESLVFAMNGFESIKLCGVGPYWSELAKMQGLQSLSIVPDDVVVSPDSYMKGVEAADLSGIENLTNLKSLMISNVPIYDLKDISKLTNLENLSLESTGLVFVEGLQNMNNLQSLGLRLNAIQDIMPVVDVLGIEGETDSEKQKSLLELADGPISSNTWYLSAEKNTPSAFEAEFAFLGNYVFDDVLVAESEGISIDKDNKTITLLEDRGSLRFNTNGRYSYYIEFLAEEDEPEEKDDDAKKEDTKNPDTGDKSILGWALGLGAVIATGVGFAIRSRR